MSNHLIRAAILEDHVLVRDSLEAVLERSGCRVVGKFADADTFLLALRELAPDVVLVDIGLERGDGRSSMDGIAVIRALAGVSPRSRCIVFSAQHHGDFIDEAREAGAWAYLSKLDATSERLVAVVESVAAGQNLLIGPARGGQSEALSPRPLTARERQVLACLSTGADNLKISALLGITERTVRAHVSSLYLKLRRENRAELALVGREMGVRLRGG